MCQVSVMVSHRLEWTKNDENSSSKVIGLIVGEENLVQIVPSIYQVSRDLREISIYVLTRSAVVAGQISVAFCPLCCF